MKFLLTILFSVVLVGCAVNNPINTQSTVDDRPRLTFTVGDYRPASYELFVDDVFYGTLETMLSNAGAVRLIPGKHKVVVKNGSKVVYNKVAYFGEGTLTLINVVSP